jgi:hypothetical protein
MQPTPCRLPREPRPVPHPATFPDRRRSTMTENGTGPEGHAPIAPDRKPWLHPAVEDLPHLTRLTLATGPGIPGECEIGGGGSTCF